MNVNGCIVSSCVSQEKKDLLVRAAQAEKGEKAGEQTDHRFERCVEPAQFSSFLNQALNKELKRVHAELQRAYALQQALDCGD